MKIWIKFILFGLGIEHLHLTWKNIFVLSKQIVCVVCVCVLTTYTVGSTLDTPQSGINDMTFSNAKQSDQLYQKNTIYFNEGHIARLSLIWV